MVAHVISFKHTVNIVKKKFEPIIGIVYFLLEGVFCLCGLLADCRAQ